MTGKQRSAELQACPPRPVRGLGPALRAGLVFGALALIAGLSACSPSAAADGSGTNTNWLKRCDDDGQCGAAGTCVCGRCTKTCDAQSLCPESSACAEQLPSSLQCGGQAMRVCQRACAQSQDCELGQLCLQGTCADPIQKACPDDALFCEDFESDRVWTAQTVSAGDEVAREPMAAPSGAFALRATVASGTSSAFWRSSLSAVQSSGDVFVSGWVRVPESKTHNVAPIALWSAAEEDWALRLVIQDGSVNLWAKTTQLTSSIALTRGEWFCLGFEAHVADSPDGQVTLTVNGEPLASASNVDTLPTSGIEAVTVGSLWSSSAAEVFVDRVVVSQQRVGCF